MRDGIRDEDAGGLIDALARWDGEGGAGVSGPQDEPTRFARSIDQRPNIDVAKLHGRIMALENLVILLLADTTPARRRLALDMATDILPRPGCTRHPLTIHAAARMKALVERAERLDYEFV